MATDITLLVEQKWNSTSQIAWNFKVISALYCISQSLKIFITHNKTDIFELTNVSRYIKVYH